MTLFAKLQTQETRGARAVTEIEEARNACRTSDIRETRESRDAGEATATGSAKIGPGEINAEKVSRGTRDTEDKKGSNEAKDITGKKTKPDARKGIHSTVKRKT